LKPYRQSEITLLYRDERISRSESRIDIADVVAILGSFDIVLGEIDR
jgi:NADH:ubiquinone oxidoreductase subunit D